MNCTRTIPYWNKWVKKYADKDVVFVSIHTPEVDAERVVENVKKYIEKEKLLFPVLIDNDKANWKKWRNQWWPSTYLIDKKGRVRGRWDGELNYKDSGAFRDVEQGIELLRREK
ncbi:redoxin domain-containing protein [Armatimonas sp.]|uniref:redoxin domain-containing protein n=1 Tax=Armatimonas sp. TaxID=1872638 RepID=UPI00286AD65B|nr:redoxin domain-containing protein [Armatimonas sp.]